MKKNILQHFHWRKISSHMNISENIRVQTSRGLPRNIKNLAKTFWINLMETLEDSQKFTSTRSKATEIGPQNVVTVNLDLPCSLPRTTVFLKTVICVRNMGTWCQGEPGRPCSRELCLPLLTCHGFPEGLMQGACFRFP